MTDADRWRQAYYELERDFMQHANWLVAYARGCQDSGQAEIGYSLVNKVCDLTGIWATLRACRENNKISGSLGSVGEVSKD